MSVSAVEQHSGQGQRARSIRASWLRLADGTPLPAFCWPIPFERAFTEKLQTECAPETGLLVVAVGEEDDVAHYAFGKLTSTTIVDSLGLATNGIKRLSNEHRAAFDEAFEELIGNPGMGDTNVLVMTVDPQDLSKNSLAHFGPREIPEMAPQLGVLAARLAA